MRKVGLKARQTPEVSAVGWESSTAAGKDKKMAWRSEQRTVRLTLEVSEVGWESSTAAEKDKKTAHR